MIEPYDIDDVTDFGRLARLQRMHADAMSLERSIAAIMSLDGSPEAHRLRLARAHSLALTDLLSQAIEHTW